MGYESEVDERIGDLSVDADEQGLNSDLVELRFALPTADMDNEFSRRLCMFRRFSKIGAIFLLLVLLFGPMLQQHDCFNDAPNLDHDAVLHTIDALFCIAFTLLIFNCLLLAFLKLRRLSWHLPQYLVRSFASLGAIFPFSPSDTSPPPLLALRV